jgi:hypothetical protein
MEIKCGCGNVVLKGKIETHTRQSKSGKMLMRSKKVFVPDDKPDGTILKNHSQQPDNWKGMCSDCQRRKDKDAKTRCSDKTDA